MGVISEMADNVIVMYAGKIVEYTNVEDLFKNPLHPYTIGLKDQSLISIAMIKKNWKLFLVLYQCFMNFQKDVSSHHVVNMLKKSVIKNVQQ